MADDEEKFLEVLSQRLGTRGIDAETSTSGEEALVKMKNIEDKVKGLMQRRP